MDTTLQTAVLDHHISLLGVVTRTILQHPSVKIAADEKQAAGVPLFQIVLALTPFAIQYLMTGKIDWAAVVAAIQALIVPTAAAKVAAAPVAIAPK